MKIDRKELTKYIFMFVIIFIALAANFYVLFVNTRKNAINSKEQEIYKAAKEYDNFLVESLDAIKLSSTKLQAMLDAKRPAGELLDYLEKESVAYSKSINNHFTGFYGIFAGEYLDGVGWVPDEDYDPYDRPWYKAAEEAEGEPAFVTPYLDMQTGTVMMSISRMLKDKDSVVSMDVSLSGVQKVVEDNVFENEWEYGIILDSEGIVVAHSDVRELGNDYKSGKDGMGHIIYDNIRRSDANYFTFKYKGDNYMAFIADMYDGWKAVSVIKSRQMLGPMNKNLIVLIITLIIIFTTIVISLKKKKKRQQKALNTNNQLNALANIYRTIFLINLEDDTFIEMSNNSDVVRQMVSDNGKDAQYTIRAVLDSVTDVRYKKSIYDFINFSTLEARLEGKNTITRDFVTIENKRCRGRFVPVEWSGDDTLKYVIWLVEIIDDGR